jgi:hypothetical protein
MSSEVKVFDWSANMARVGAGFKANPFFKDPNLAPSVNVGMGYPKEVDEKMQMKMSETPKPLDVWATRGK